MRVVCTWQVRQRRMLVFFPRTAHDVHEASCGLRCPSVGRKFGSGASRAFVFSFFVSFFRYLIAPFVRRMCPLSYVPCAALLFPICASYSLQILYHKSLLYQYIFPHVELYCLIEIAPPPCLMLLVFAFPPYMFPFIVMPYALCAMCALVPCTYTPS